MDEKDVVITYETLFELLRLEKNREDLQKLDESFFEDVLTYLNDKKATFESKESQSILFATDDKEKARLELENIKKILKELYDKREKKIVYTALNNVRAGVNLVNTTSMLPSEKILFKSMSSVLSELRRSVLFKLANCESPDTDLLSDNVISKLSSSITGALDAELPENIPEEPGESMQEPAVDTFGAAPDPGKPAQPLDSSASAADEPKELKTSPDFGDYGANIKKVRFLAPIGEIVGPDLKIYGPYEEGTVISLPDELASVLLEKKQAETVAN
jgi:DNA replication initiation complex subunit (GINS family)